jgi:hypothetical protein
MAARPRNDCSKRVRRAVVNVEAQREAFPGGAGDAAGHLAVVKRARLRLARPQGRTS